jgi:glycine hydroxymethyltransferase
VKPTHAGYFHTPLSESDPQVAQAIQGELARQQQQIELIASENLVSRGVLEAQGSIFTNKTVEGYAGRRYHGGADYADAIEALAIERAKRLFDCSYANVQPHSGSQANQVVFLAFLKPGDKILSMALAAGGHLSHGAAPNLSGKWFAVTQYGVAEESGLIDYDTVDALANEHRPKLIIAGGSAYPRIIDFARFRRIADRVGALLLVDMAHFAGLVAGNMHPSPLPYANVVTTTTYKSLRGARGGLILANDAAIGKKIDAALFPGLQGSAMLHAIAGKAVCLGEALRPEFREYARQVVENAKQMADTLQTRAYRLVAGGTDTALMLLDLRPQGLTGKAAVTSLEAAGLTCNKNAIPGDPQPPTVTSGVRLSAAARKRRHRAHGPRTSGRALPTFSNLLVS